MEVRYRAPACGRPALLAGRPRPCPASVDCLEFPLGPRCLNFLHLPLQFWIGRPAGTSCSPQQQASGLCCRDWKVKPPPTAEAS